MKPIIHAKWWMVMLESATRRSRGGGGEEVPFLSPFSRAGEPPTERTLMRKEESSNERVLAVLHITRDPRTNRFHCEMSVRQDWDGFDGILKSDHSASRLTWFLHTLAPDAFMNLVISRVYDRWGDVLAKQLGDDAERGEQGALATD